jgi:hypothetical protein
MDDYTSSSLNTKMAVFIIFTIALVLAYLVLWTPFVNGLNRDVIHFLILIMI